MQLPGVASTIAAITRALAGYPAARQCVIEYLKTADTADDTLALPAPEVIDATRE